MRIISLNTLTGFFLEPLLDFVKEAAAETDVFCFQEMTDTKVEGAVDKGYRPNLFSEMKKALPDFEGFFTSMHPAHENFNSKMFGGMNVDYGITTFVKKTQAVSNSGDFYIYKDASFYKEDDINSHPQSLQYVQMKINGRILTVCNFYGAPYPGTKLDTPERLLQSRKALDFLSEQEGEKIVVGDFNLLPQTKSITMFEEAGFRNLIKDFSIKTTRGSLNKKMNPQYANTPQGFQEFADYAFVSSGISVSDFKVPDISISDHLPLVLDFKIT